MPETRKGMRINLLEDGEGIREETRAIKDALAEPNRELLIELPRGAVEQLHQKGTAEIPIVNDRGEKIGTAVLRDYWDQ